MWGCGCNGKNGRRRSGEVDAMGRKVEGGGGGGGGGGVDANGKEGIMRRG